MGFVVCWPCDCVLGVWDFVDDMSVSVGGRRTTRMGNGSVIFCFVELFAVELVD